MKTKTGIGIAIASILSTLSIFSYTEAAERSDLVLPVEQIYSVPTSCESPTNIYLNEDNDGDTLPDYYLFLNSNFIYPYSPVNQYSAVQILREYGGTEYSKVKYYRPMANMLYKVNKTTLITGDIDDMTFWRPSRVFPYNVPVRGIASNPNRIVFEQPSDNNASKNKVAFVYHYKYYINNGKLNGTSNYTYIQVPSLGYMSDANLSLTYLSPNNTRNWINPVLTKESCQQFKLSRCGDGTIDAYTETGNRANVWGFTGELCDDGTNNGKPGYCDTTCWAWGWFYCGDEIINDGSSDTVYESGGVLYGPTYYSGTELIFETCDDGNDPNDPDGLYNLDWDTMFCSSICFDNFQETFVEVFINE